MSLYWIQRYQCHFLFQAAFEKSMSCDAMQRKLNRLFNGTQNRIWIILNVCHMNVLILCQVIIHSTLKVCNWNTTRRNNRRAVRTKHYPQHVSVTLYKRDRENTSDTRDHVCWPPTAHCFFSSPSLTWIPVLASRLIWNSNTPAQMSTSLWSHLLEFRLVPEPKWEMRQFEKNSAPPPPPLLSFLCSSLTLGLAPWHLLAALLAGVEAAFLTKFELLCARSVSLPSFFLQKNSLPLATFFVLHSFFPFRRFFSLCVTTANRVLNRSRQTVGKVLATQVRERWKSLSSLGVEVSLSRTRMGRKLGLCFVLHGHRFTGWKLFKERHMYACHIARLSLDNIFSLFSSLLPKIIFLKYFIFTLIQTTSMMHDTNCFVS